MWGEARTKHDLPQHFLCKTASISRKFHPQQNSSRQFWILSPIYGDTKRHWDSSALECCSKCPLPTHSWRARRIKFTVRSSRREEDPTSMDDVAKNWERCPEERDQKGGINWPRSSWDACGWSLWLELRGRRIPQTHRAWSEPSFLRESWNGLGWKRP